ncbi:MAG: SDR family oxidoreductase [Gemmatimonadetes bacterium]|nr:SDR family oxidoreductase [Gemmatimonadota bacterium]
MLAEALAGRTALVAGASRGIGRAVAQRLRAAGAELVMVARGEAALRAAAQELGACAVVADVADAAAVARLSGAVREMLGVAAPDIVVNAAGSFHLAPLAETEPADFDAQLAANLRAPFLVIRAFLPAMLARRSGHLLTLGSVAGRRAFLHNGAYSAAKFGVRGLHAVLDEELRGTGVRATLIEPAATDTGLWDHIDYARHPGLPPRQAMLSAEAVAAAVLYAVMQPPEVDVRSIVLERT